MCEGQSSAPSGAQLPALLALAAQSSLSHSPLCGLWRFHHKGVTVVNSLAAGPDPTCSPNVRRASGPFEEPT